MLSHFPAPFRMLRKIPGALCALVLIALVAPSTPAQTAGGTQIQNQATASYSDGTNNYSTSSNTVTVTVANVAGLSITPDAGTVPTVVAGQTNVLYTFTITNGANFSDRVNFLANGQSLQVTGPGTITQAVIDVNNSNTIDAGDTNILTNGADVASAAIAPGGTIRVLASVSINAAANPGDVVKVQLGDASIQAGATTPFDNLPADNSAHEVHTLNASANGPREAQGDASATVDTDALLRAILTAPAGPVGLGADISYTAQLCNYGARAAQSVTLSGNTGVYVIAPIPQQTSLKAGQTFPAGTLYTTSPLATAPVSAVWTTTAPGTLSSVTRIAFNVGATLGAAAGATPTCSANLAFIVTVNANANATSAIYEIVDSFGNNSLGNLLTDQSGDNVNNKGDSNADYNEPKLGGIASANQGFQQPTTLQQVGGVLLGTVVGGVQHPDATGPTGTNDDFTNKSVNTGIAGVPPGGVTTASGQVVFDNSVQNTGNANDTFTLGAPTVPTGFTVEISTDGGATYTTMSGGGSVSLAVAFGASAAIKVRVTAPSGQTVLQGYDTVIQAASTITPANKNNTIDRLFTGFVRLNKTYSVSNTTGIGNATDPVPGAVITYSIQYQNIATSLAGTTNSATLTASNLVITENGNTAPNNWATYTSHVAGQASDTNGGTITGDTGGSNILTDTLPTLSAGNSGTFSFKRKIN